MRFISSNRSFLSSIFHDPTSYSSDPPLQYRLERIKTSIAEQQANIDRLEREAQELVAREEEEGATPEPDPPTP